jgi:monofunctional biosynthetic peptidoglycan transglycosylase
MLMVVDSESDSSANAPIQDSGGMEPTVSTQVNVEGWLAWFKKHKVIIVLSVFFIFCVCEYFSLPNEGLLKLRRTNPARTALMEQRIEEAKSQGKTLKIYQTWVPLSQISPFLIHAVIVSEDGTFYEHEGVDWYEMKESVEKDIEQGKAARGGSTITQQLAKNLFLSTSKDPLRKIKELVIALRMEHILSKGRILELYLNEIEWGSGIYGAEAAARKYFGTSAADLTRDQATRMAAVIPSPLKHQPNQDSRYVQRRAEIISLRMTARGY